jgi:DNA invertase Pin-like site-specific DNA recombinase
MRVAIYTRVSREEQITGYSLDAQLDACRGYALTQGWEIVNEFIEPGVTGTSDKRPAFQAMIRSALAGECDVVLVHKYDRLNRNRFDAVLYKRMLREKGVLVISASEPGSEDGPAGMLVEGMLEVIAEWYSANLSTEVRKGIRRKAANGEPVGPVPLGYYREPGTSWVAITELGGRITEAFQEFATGRYSLSAWATEACRQGYRSRSGGRIHAGNWQAIFRNRFYIGVIVYDGNEYQGKHTALVDEGTFMAVQNLLDSRPGAHHGPPQQYLLSGLLWSADHGRLMTGTTAKGMYRYYRAKTNGQSELLIPEPVAEEQIIGYLHHVVINGVGADLSSFPAALRLALTVAPSVGAVYAALESLNDRRELLRGVVTRVVIEGHEVTGLELVDGFEFDSDRSGSPDSNPHPPTILTSLLYTACGPSYA